jgi:hypothetical protein
VPAPSAVFRPPKPNQWRTANMVALRSGRCARVLAVHACTGPSWARGRGLAASGGARGGCRAVPLKNPSPLETVLDRVGPPARKQDFGRASLFLFRLLSRPGRGYFF